MALSSSFSQASHSCSFVLYDSSAPLSATSHCSVLRLNWIIESCHLLLRCTEETDNTGHKPNVCELRLLSLPPAGFVWLLPLEPGQLLVPGGKRFITEHQ